MYIFRGIVAGEKERVGHEVVLVTQRNAAEAVVFDTYECRAGKQALSRQKTAVVDGELTRQLEDRPGATAQIFGATKTQQVRPVDAVVRFYLAVAIFVADVGDANVEQAVEGDAALRVRR